MKDKILDLTTIESIRKLQKPDRPDLLKELIQLFFNNTSDYLKILRAAVDNRDMGTVSHIAHNFKSSAASLGALKLSEICYELEKIGNGQVSSERIKEVFQQIEHSYEKVMAELKKL